MFRAEHIGQPARLPHASRMFRAEHSQVASRRAWPGGVGWPCTGGAKPAKPRRSPRPIVWMLYGGRRLEDSPAGLPGAGALALLKNKIHPKNASPIVFLDHK